MFNLKVTHIVNIPTTQAYKMSGCPSRKSVILLLIDIDMTLLCDNNTYSVPDVCYVQCSLKAIL